MATLIFGNNATSFLAGPISAAATTATLSAGSGSLFPNPGAGEYFVATIVDAATGLTNEVVHVTNVDVGTSTVTMTRGQESTTAKNWLANDLFASLWTAGQASAMMQQGQFQGQTSNYAVDFGSTNAVQANFNPAITAPVTVGMPLRVKIANTNTGPSTFNPGPGAVPVRLKNGNTLAGEEMVAGAIVEFIYDGTFYQVNTVKLPSVYTPKLIYGLTYSRTTGTNITIDAGGATSETNDMIMEVPSMVKVTNAAWAAGSGAGLLDTTPVGDSPYYLFIIGNPTTGDCDLLASTLINPVATLPAGFTKKRLIGWYKRAAGAVTPFHTYEMGGGGLEYRWDTPVLDIDTEEVLTTSRRLDALSVPNGISVMAIIDLMVHTAGQVGVVGASVWVGCPDQVDQAPSPDASPLGNASIQGGFSLSGGDQFVNGYFPMAQRHVRIRTNTAMQIAARSNKTPAEQSAGYPIYRAATVGFELARR